MPPRPISPLLGLFVSSLAWGCGAGGGSGPGAGLIVSGTVRSPGGDSIGLRDAGSRRAWVRSSHGIDLPGLLPVPDFTPVELVRVDAQGVPLVALAGGVTVGGGYSYDFDALNVDPATSLTVVAGSGATRLRALAVQSKVDIDPLTEAVVQLILQQGVRLDRLTNKEASDFQAAVEFLAVTDGLVAQADVASTVALIRQAVLAEPELILFLSLAAAEGQTDAGPGDVGDFFAYELGNTWRASALESIDGGAPVPYESSLRIVERDLAGMLTFEEVNALAEGENRLVFLRETSAAITSLGNDDPTDPLAAVVPYDETRFPLRVGEQRLLFDAEDLDLGEDLDGDGTSERLEARAERTTVGFETRTVPAGTFRDSLRLDTTLDTTVRLSAGGSVTAVATTTEWFAPDVGPVRTETEIATTFSGDTSVSRLVEELQSYLVGDVGRGILPPRELATDLGPANSNAEQPGRPALGSDGAGYLLVTCRDSGDVAELVGVRISNKGLVEQEFPILELQSAPDCRPRPSVVFIGTSHFVVFVDQGQLGQPGRVRGVRVSPDGLVLDPGGFDIAESGSSSSQPTVAFDGAKSLVVWRRFDSQTSGDIYGAFVGTDGTSLGEFPIYEAVGDQRSPSVIFAGGLYLVVWSDAELGTPEIRAARVSSLGDILDPDGIVVSNEPGAQGELAPQVSFDDEAFLIVWLRSIQPSFGHAHVYAKRFGVLGFPDAKAIPITTLDLPNASVTVTFDGENHLIAWDTATFDETAGIHLARVTPDGTLLGRADDEPPLTVARPPDFARLVRPLIQAGINGAFLAWVMGRELSGASKSVDGTLIFPF